MEIFEKISEYINAQNIGDQIPYFKILDHCFKTLPHRFPLNVEDEEDIDDVDTTEIYKRVELLIDAGVLKSQVIGLYILEKKLANDATFENIIDYVNGNWKSWFCNDLFEMESI